MDIVKAPLLLLVALLADAGFISSLLSGAAEAGMPHTVGELGAVLGAGLYLAVSQLFQAWRNRRQLRRELSEALAQHGITPGAPGPPADAV